MLDKPKETKTMAQDELAKTLVQWDGRGIKLNNVSNMGIKFNIHVIKHKIYSSIRPNSVPCEAVDLSSKVVKNNLSFDIAKL